MKRNPPSALTSLSFFSGCGGLDLGLELSGIEQRLVCDFDKSARASLAANRPGIPVIDNILDYTSAQLREIAGLQPDERPTLVVGGPPCQAFSTAGKRGGFTDPRGNVFLRYIQLIDELQPDYAVIENVRGLLSAALRHRPHEERGPGFAPLDRDELPGGALAHVLREFAAMGYGVRFNLYNSANYGVPQIRERVILIAARDGSQVPFLKPTHSENGDFGLPKWRTFKDAVEGLDASKNTGIGFPESRLKYYRLLGPGQHWKHLPTLELRMEAMGKSFHLGGGKTGFLRRIAWDRPSPTLVTNPAMPATDLGHPVEDRPLSVQEYKRVQMFPDDWEISGSILNQYKQIGNAVPVGLGQAVGKAITDHMNGVKHNTCLIGFPYSRYKNTNDVEWRAAFEKELANLDRREQLNLAL